MRINCAFDGCKNTIDETELSQQSHHGLTPSFAGVCKEHLLWGIRESIKKRRANLYEYLDAISVNVEDIKNLEEMEEYLK